MRYFFSVFFFLLFSGLQAQQMADFLSIEAEIEPFLEAKKVEGRVKVRFISLIDQDSLFLDAKNMKITNVAQESVTVSSDDAHLWLLGPFQEGHQYTAFFTYEAFPKQALYFTNDQIWTQGQGKYTSHWLPSLDLMTDKIEFDLSLIVPDNKMAIANGSLKGKMAKSGKTLWQFEMEQPMSSYLVAFAIGDFRSQSHTVRGIPLQFYYPPEDSLKWEPTYRHTEAIFSFLEDEIGIPYPWNTYKQVPIKDFLYAGMENTTTTFFSQAFVVDSIGYVDRNYVNVNAHEMAHQWFGNLVTETEGTHHWLHEGFATYYALLAEKKLFGEDYFYWKLYTTAEKLKTQSDMGQGEALLNPKASSLTYYEKGAWALHILKESMGATAFKKGVKYYLERYAYQNVDTDDFLHEMEKASGMDLSQWRKDWLEQSAFKAEQAFESLLKSEFIKKYFELVGLRNLPFEEKRERLISAIKSNNDFLGQEAVYQLASEAIETGEPLYALALAQDNLFVRQAVAISLVRIPVSLQTSYETLLNDASYVTQEAALYNLWMNFPEKRKVYLERMDAIFGFQDLNVRQLWLALALFTDGYPASDKELFSSELQGYSSPRYSYEIREKAFEFLYSMNLVTDSVLKNLVNASTHHYWRFRDVARSFLDEVMKQENTRKRILAMMEDFNTQEKDYLQRKYELK